MRLRVVLAIGAVVVAAVLVACPTVDRARVTEEGVEGTFNDGRYRGTFEDRGDQQVSIQFHLEDNVLYDLSYRHLYHAGIDYRDDHDHDQIVAIQRQHDRVLEYLEGKPLEAIFDLYDAGRAIGDEYDVDGATGATVRTNKILSAIKDGLNRDIYAPANGYNARVPAYQDGRYRGIFGDRGVQQVSIQFHVEDGEYRNLSYRHLYHAGLDYRDDHDHEQIVAIQRQHDEILSYLDGRPLSAAFDLHDPGMVIGTDHDVDGATGATVRANKVFSAIMDGLNRGVY